MGSRKLELLVMVAVVALAAFLVQPQTSKSDLVFGEFAFNGVHLGDKVADLEKQWGPPDFKNPHAYFQQWEHPLTQLHYDDRGIVIEVGGSGTGRLTQGSRSLLQCGVALEKGIVPLFGPPPGGVKDNFYRYSGLTIHCGSESQGVRIVSHIQLVAGIP